MAASGPLPAPGPGSKEPWLGVNLSLCLPGLGQWYAGARASAALQLGAALVLIGAGGLFTLVPELNGAVGLILVLGLVPLWVFSAWTAHRDCRDRATPGFDELRRSQRAAMVSVGLCGAPFLFAYTKAYLVRAFRVASGSMAPILEPGDRVFVDLRTPGRASIGDVVLLPFPNRPDQVFLKTAFAPPGDVVEFRGDGAYRNGEPTLALPPAHASPDPCSTG